MNFPSVMDEVLAVSVTNQTYTLPVFSPLLSFQSMFSPPSLYLSRPSISANATGLSPFSPDLDLSLSQTPKHNQPKLLTADLVLSVLFLPFATSLRNMVPETFRCQMERWSTLL